MFCFPFLRWVKFGSGCFRRDFFYVRDKKVVAGRVRQVVFLHRNDCMGICLGELIIVLYRRVVVL